MKTINAGDPGKFYPGDLSPGPCVPAKREGLVGDIVCGVVLLLVIALLATRVISGSELLLIVVAFGGPALIMSDIRGG